MERITGGSDLGITSRRQARPSADGKENRIARTDPRSRSVNPSFRAAEFAAFSDNLRRDLDPRGPLERLMADHVVLTAWRLRASLDRHAPSDPRDDPDAVKPKRTSPLATDREARSVRDALETLDYLRDRRSRMRQTPPSPLEKGTETGPEIAPNEWPIVPSEDLGDTPAEVSIWRDRLVYDFDISDVSPVVKGTWITVGHVVSLIVDGWTWADILRSHPELVEDDIRTCVAYAVAEENAAA